LGQSSFVGTAVLVLEVVVVAVGKMGLPGNSGCLAAGSKLRVVDNNQVEVVVEAVGVNVVYQLVCICLK